MQWLTDLIFIYGKEVSDYPFLMAVITAAILDLVSGTLFALNHGIYISKKAKDGIISHVLIIIIATFIRFTFNMTHNFCYTAYLIVMILILLMYISSILETLDKYTDIHLKLNINDLLRSLLDKLIKESRK